MINGLTKKQKTFAKILQEFDYVDQINQFIESLPDIDKKDAITVYELMIAHYIDQYDETEIADALWEDLTNKWKE
jgi:hypothetical protein